MPTNTTSRTRLAQETVNAAAGARLRDAKALFSLVPSPRNGLMNPTEAFSQTARLSKRLTEVNVKYVWALGGAVREHIAGLASVLKDEVLTTGKLANEQAQKAEEAVIAQAEDIQRAERNEARRARKAARDTAAAKYEEMTKVELSDELAKRDLLKSGNVDELRERLIDDDLQASSAGA